LNEPAMEPNKTPGAKPGEVQEELDFHEHEEDEVFDEAMIRERFSPYQKFGEKVLERTIQHITAAGPLSVSQTLRMMTLPTGRRAVTEKAVAEFLMPSERREQLCLEGGLLWAFLESLPFVDSEASGPVYRMHDPSRRVAPDVPLSRVDPACAARAFGSFCVWLMRKIIVDYDDEAGGWPEGKAEAGEEIPQRVMEPFRTWMHAYLGMSAWGSGWVDQVEFIRWAWREGVLSGRQGWEFWERNREGLPWIPGVPEEPDYGVEEGAKDGTR